MKPGLAGAAAGTGATVAMTGAMALGKATGALGESPPRKITRRGLRSLVGENPDGVTPLAALLHVLFGVAAGALYGATLGRRRRRGPELWGIGYGLAVWGASYAGWAPALGLMPSPSRDRPGRQPVNVCAHVLYGATLGRLTNLMSQDGADESGRRARQRVGAAE
jgi:hypothetical protein